MIRQYFLLATIFALTLSSSSASAAPLLFEQTVESPFPGSTSQFLADFGFNGNDTFTFPNFDSLLAPDNPASPNSTIFSVYFYEDSSDAPGNVITGFSYTPVSANKTLIIPLAAAE